MKRYEDLISGKVVTKEDILWRYLEARDTGAQDEGPLREQIYRLQQIIVDLVLNPDTPFSLVVDTSIYEEI